MTETTDAEPLSDEDTLTANQIRLNSNPFSLAGNKYSKKKFISLERYKKLEAENKALKEKIMAQINPKGLTENNRIAFRLALEEYRQEMRNQGRIKCRKIKN